MKHNSKLEKIIDIPMKPALMKISNIHILFVFISVIFLLLFLPISFSYSKPELAAPVAAKEVINHIDVEQLSNVIEQLNSGEKDFVFISGIFTKKEKKFLERLRMKFLKENSSKKSHGGILNIHGDMNDNNIKNFSQNATRDLTAFFDKYTNARALGEELGLDGPLFLANLIFGYSKILLSQFNVKNPDANTNCVYFYLKALKENNSFSKYKRWHFDGDGATKSNTNANVNFAGVLVGVPTIFVSVNDETRKSYKNIVKETRDVSITAEEIIGLIKGDQANYAVNSKEYGELQEEINKVLAINSSDSPNKNKVLDKVYRRIKVQHLIDMSKVYQAGKNQVFVFTKEGRNPALHSEPDMKNSRLFFALGVDKANFVPEGTYYVSNEEAPDPADFKPK